MDYGPLCNKQIVDHQYFIVWAVGYIWNDPMGKGQTIDQQYSILWAVGYMWGFVV